MDAANTKNSMVATSKPVWLVLSIMCDVDMLRVLEMHLKAERKCLDDLF